MRLFLLAVASAALVACSPSKGSADSGSETASAVDSRSSPDDTGAADSGEAELAWIGVGGSAVLSGGVLTDAHFDFALYVDPDVGPACTSTRSANPSAVVVEVSPDPTIYHWWRLSLEISDGEDACAAPLPQSLLFGLGAMHPDIAPALPEHELDGVSDSLYGAYANLDPEHTSADTAFVFGFAGTAADRAGASVAVTGPPMPDGDYAFTGYYLFAVPE